MTLLEIRNLLLEKSGEDIFQEHPHKKHILDKIILSQEYGDEVDYANLLEEIISVCEEQRQMIGFGDEENS